MNRNHQTAVFVRVGDSENGNYRERAARLIESLNRHGDSPSGTIKADVYTVDPYGNVREGLDFDAAVAPAAKTDADLNALASDAGYTASVIVTAT